MRKLVLVLAVLMVLVSPCFADTTDEISGEEQSVTENTDNQNDTEQNNEDNTEPIEEPIVLEKPKITSGKMVSVCKAKLKWKPIENATCYEVYRYYNGWKKMTTTKDVTATVQGIHKKKLKYKVRAVYSPEEGDIIYSDYSNIKKVYTKAIVGQARSGDKNDKLGNQTGNELVITNWQCTSSRRKFTMVLRMKDPKKAEKLAYTVEKACKGRYVGWTMTKGKRITFYKELKKVGWDINKLHKNCSTSCTRLACAAINASGVKFAYDIDSYDLRKEAKKHTKDIKIFYDKSYTRSYTKLKRGDILCDEPHHTVIVL